MWGVCEGVRRCVVMDTGVYDVHCTCLCVGVFGCIFTGVWMSVFDGCGCVCVHSVMCRDACVDVKVHTFRNTYMNTWYG